MAANFYRVDMNDRSMMENVYRLRYQVFCLEEGILDPYKYPEGLERDEFDLDSVHFIATDDHGTVIGTVRLVMYSEYGFPIQKHCEFYPGTAAVDDARVAEISRLAVGQLWRNPRVTLGLWRLIYQESKKLHIQYWYAAMERCLARLLRKFAMDFEEIGPTTMYNGVRIPFFTSIEDVESSMAYNKPELFSYFSRGFARETNNCDHLLFPSTGHCRLSYANHG